MNISELKSQYEHLPHVKKVWVKNEQVYTSPVHGATEIDLTETNSQEVQETAPIAKPKKNK